MSWRTHGEGYNEAAQDYGYCPGANGYSPDMEVGQDWIEVAALLTDRKRRNTFHQTFVFWTMRFGGSAKS